MKICVCASKLVTPNLDEYKLNETRLVYTCFLNHLNYNNLGCGICYLGYSRDTPPPPLVYELDLNLNYGEKP